MVVILKPMITTMPWIDIDDDQAGRGDPIVTIGLLVEPLCDLSLVGRGLVRPVFQDRGFASCWYWENAEAMRSKVQRKIDGRAVNIGSCHG